MAPPADIATSDESNALVLRPTGHWLVVSAAALDRRLKGLKLPSGRNVTIDLAQLDRVDTTGAWLLVRTEHALEALGNKVEVVNTTPSFAPLIDQVRLRGAVAPIPHPIPPHHTFTGFVARIGEIFLNVMHRGYQILAFGGQLAETIVLTFRHPRRFRMTSTLVQMELTGLDAMPIVGLLAFLIGVVFAYQGADQLRRFGAEIYTVNLLGIAILRELGVLLTAIVIAGRSGSAFTAQIGTMQVNQEIDAMHTLGLNPTEVLVLPRVLGLVLTLPLLVFYADFLGMLGGCLMSWLTLGISIPRFLDQLRGAITEWTLWVGVIKAPFFAAIISMVGCYEGFNVSGSADSVGRLTTQSVVESIFLVIVADAGFSILFSLLKI